MFKAALFAAAGAAVLMSSPADARHYQHHHYRHHYYYRASYWPYYRYSYPVYSYPVYYRYPAYYAYPSYPTFGISIGSGGYPRYYYGRRW